MLLPPHGPALMTLPTLREQYSHHALAACRTLKSCASG